ncbi:MAG: nuclear transport factor 2 family protein [Chitinophagaceae bacterium]|nr:nuclear transport factor 2 family protein [Chitinophagaceae bacterium]
MKLLILVFSFFISLACLSQNDTSAVLKAVRQLEAGLQKKDSSAVKSLLHPALAFGHSNGWVQSAASVIADMASGYLVYQKIEPLSTAIEMHLPYATVKEKLNAEGNVNGNNFNLKLFVLQLWVNENGSWKLISRQSTKL